MSQEASVTVGKCHSRQVSQEASVKARDLWRSALLLSQPAFLFLPSPSPMLFFSRFSPFSSFSFFFLWLCCFHLFIYFLPFYPPCFSSFFPTSSYSLTSLFYLSFILFFFSQPSTYQYCFSGEMAGLRCKKWVTIHFTVVQNEEKSRKKYWATHFSVCSFAHTAHSFACSALLTLLTLWASHALLPSLVRLLAHPLTPELLGKWMIKWVFLLYFLSVLDHRAMDLLPASWSTSSNTVIHIS